MCTARFQLSALAIAGILAACGDTLTSPVVDGAAPSFSVTTYDCAVQLEIPAAECEALAALYESANGPGWTQSSGWLATATPCSWFGVSCASGHVVELVLPSNQLAGPIPAELGNLASLRNLWLPGNQLTGAIPPALGDLGSLWNLHLMTNQLTGSIPVELGNLADLVNLMLGGNQLTGTIPAELGNLVDLERLNIASNQLTGMIPVSLGGLDKLVALEIGGNQLSGPIPPELGNLAALENLFLGGNRLTGVIPAELGDLGELTSMKLAGNLLTGAIPPELGGLARLEVLELAMNQLSGGIPAELGDLADLKKLDLGLNQLTGGIPAELGGLTRLENLQLPVNRLTGPIPAEIGSLAGLRTLNVAGNQLAGLIPLAAATRGAAIQAAFGNSKCLFVPPGNAFLYMPDVQAYRDADLDRDGRICGVVLYSPAMVASRLTGGVSGLLSRAVLNTGQAAALTRKVEQAVKLLDKGNTAEAIEVLQEFIGQVNSLVWNDLVLTEPQAAPLIAWAEILIALIEMGAGT
jgi:hypothetical protein